MVTKKDTETPSSVQLSFLVHKLSGKAPFFFFFFSYTQSFKEPIGTELLLCFLQ